MAYCTSECESIDARSPSSTSCSSAVASPQYASFKTGLADVPALTSSVLGGKLSTYTDRARYSNYSSSSASSTAWSGLSDEDDDNVSYAFSGDEDYPSVDLPKAGFLAVKNPLSYARHPSATNHRSVVSRPRGYSPARDLSRSAPARRSYPAQHSSTDDDVEDSTLSPRPRLRRVPSKKPDGVSPSTSVVSSSSKRSRNRSSLPASFALLSISSSTAQPASHYSKGSPSSVNTAATLSTHRLADSVSTLRGRPREVGDSVDARARDSVSAFKIDSERRGRRRSEELDPNDLAEYQAPGLGGGRSGLSDRRTGRYR